MAKSKSTQSPAAGAMPDRKVIQKRISDISQKLREARAIIANAHSAIANMDEGEGSDADFALRVGCRMLDEVTGTDIDEVKVFAPGAGGGVMSTRKKHARRRRERPAIVEINLANKRLHALMTEQFRDGGYITRYRGSRGELMAAGVPEMTFPSGRKVVAFRVQTLNVCCTGSYEILSGSMRSIAGGYELEVDWGSVMPYIQGAHPAITELARMISIYASEWTEQRPGRPPDLRRPMDLLVQRGEPCGAAKLQVTPEFHKLLSDHLHSVYHFVHQYGEVLARAAEPSVSSKLSSGPRLVVDNTLEVRP